MPRQESHRSHRLSSPKFHGVLIVIPNHRVSVAYEHGHGCRFKQSAEPFLAFAELSLSLLVLGDLVKAIDVTCGSPSLFSRRPDIDDDNDPGAIGLLDEYFLVTRLRYFAVQDLAHGALIEGHKTAVWPE